MKRNSKKKDDEAPKEAEVKEETKGNGSFIFNNGSGKYVGDWCRFDGAIKRHGRGIYEENGNKYDGEWKEDKMHGKGTFQFATGASFEVQILKFCNMQGDWVEGKYEGNGKFKFPDGSVYEGEFRDNSMHGIGIYIDINKIAYKGQFYNNTGPGLVQWQN